MLAFFLKNSNDKTQTKEAFYSYDKYLLHHKLKEDFFKRILIKTIDKWPWMTIELEMKYIFYIIDEYEEYEK